MRPRPLADLIADEVPDLTISLEGLIDGLNSGIQGVELDLAEIYSVPEKGIEMVGELHDSLHTLAFQGC